MGTQAMPLERFSLSIEKALLNKLEALVKRSGYENRSEFIRDMIRQRLVEAQWKNDEEVVGTITLLYDHETRELNNKLTRLQHQHHHVVLASTHVHLDHHLCAEMILAKGKAGLIQEIAHLLHQQKGVLHAALSLSSTGKELG
jgi:CopG family nickel-responsive transcriptional regulator